MDNIGSKKQASSSLVFKISFFVGLILFVSLVVISSVFIFSERSKILSDIVKNGETFANSTIEKIYGDYAQFYTHPRPEDFENFKNLTQATLKNNKDVVGVSLIAFNGRILFDSGEFVTGKATIERNVEDPVLLNLLKQDKNSNREIQQENGNMVTEIIVPLQELGGGHILSMRYLISNKSLDERMSEVYQQIIFTVIPLLVLVILLAVPFTVSLVRPINKLTEAVEKIRRGNLDEKIEVKSRDEIGKLAASFNVMTEDLKISREKVEESRRKLEEYSKSLEEKVKERTKELETKNTELERMNKFMVDREMKIIELKKRVSELEQGGGGTKDSSS